MSVDTGGEKVLENLKNSKKTVGVKQSQKAIESGSVIKVYIAKDAEDKVVRSIINLCQESSIIIEYVDDMKQLGKACGVDVGASTVCVLK